MGITSGEIREPFLLLPTYKMCEIFKYLFKSEKKSHIHYIPLVLFTNA